MKYEVVQSRRWFNKRTGGTASIYGASPYTSDADACNWHIEAIGWTVRNNETGTVGVGRAPWQVKEEAQAWADTQNAARCAK